MFGLAGKTNIRASVPSIHLSSSSSNNSSSDGSPDIDLTHIPRFTDGLGVVWAVTTVLYKLRTSVYKTAGKFWIFKIWLKHFCIDLPGNICRQAIPCHNHVICAPVNPTLHQPHSGKNVHVFCYMCGQLWLRSDFTSLQCDKAFTDSIMLLLTLKQTSSWRTLTIHNSSTVCSYLHCSDNPKEIFSGYNSCKSYLCSYELKDIRLLPINGSQINQLLHSWVIWLDQPHTTFMNINFNVCNTHCHAGLYDTVSYFHFDQAWCLG